MTGWGLFAKTKIEWGRGVGLKVIGRGFKPKSYKVEVVKTFCEKC